MHHDVRLCANYLLNEVRFISFGVVCRSSTKVVFGKEFPQKNVAGCLFRHTFQDAIFFVKWQNVQLCMKINFIKKIFIYCPWFSRNNSISGTTSLKALRKESLPER